MDRKHSCSAQPADYLKSQWDGKCAAILGTMPVDEHANPGSGRHASSLVAMANEECAKQPGSAAPVPFNDVLNQMKLVFKTESQAVVANVYCRN